MSDTGVRWGRRAVALCVIVVQIFFVVRAYSADQAFFGFQMFPESSEWQATIERELADGTRVDVRDDWPGGYEWAELVVGRGLQRPFARHPASAGLDSTLHFLEESLEWVAVHTPDDTEAVRLVATVTSWRNGSEAETVVYVAER
ncbi:MAG: hypothetical protein ACERLM_02615 [Acidimicrobiales bacterium]